MIHAEQLRVEPESFGREEMPLYATAVLVSVPELPAHPRSAAVDHHLFRIDKITRRDLAAAVERRGQRKRAVGFEITESAHEVLPVDRQPVPFEAAVDRPHPIGRLVD